MGSPTFVQARCNAFLLQGSLSQGLPNDEEHQTSQLDAEQASQEEAEASPNGNKVPKGYMQCSSIDDGVT